MKKLGDLGKLKTGLNFLDSEAIMISFLTDKVGINRSCYLKAIFLIRFFLPI